MGFDFQIAFVLLLLFSAVFVLSKEWLAPDVTAMSALCILLITNILTVDQALTIFSNPAPITIGAMFILSYALQKTGAIDRISHIISHHLSPSLPIMLLGITSFVALFSAFVNNTPVVAIFMPILLSLARSRNIPASKLLIPLSYASIMGGCSTLIGTSTNIIVSGIAAENGQEPIGMFELTKVAIPLLIIGLIYIVFVAPLFLPERVNVTAALSPDERKNFLCQVLVKKDSSLIGQVLTETVLAKKKSDFRIIEVRRKGTRVMLPLNEIKVEPFDRILLSASTKQMIELPKVDGITLANEIQGELGIENLSTIEGSIVEGIIAPNSNLIGHTIRNINFRQTYGMIILAVHRHGRNLSKNFQDIRLQFGDTLLMLGPLSTFDKLHSEGDFMLLEDRQFLAPRRDKSIIAWLAIVSVVALTSLSNIPIVTAAIIAAVCVVLFRCLEPKEAYQAVDWSIIFLIYGMLSIGKAMEVTEADKWIANSLVTGIQYLASPEILPYVALCLCYIITSILTELLSNNATAVVMAPVAMNCAIALGLEPRPFVIAVMIAASAAFVTPIGYQTNTMVYGAGGYRFTDFVKFGLPLSITFWITCTFLIPYFWPFK